MSLSYAVSPASLWIQLNSKLFEDRNQVLLRTYLIDLYT